MRKLLLVLLIAAAGLVVYRAYTLGDSPVDDDVAAETEASAADSVSTYADTSSDGFRSELPGPESVPPYSIVGEDVLRTDDYFTVSRYVRVADEMPGDSLRAMLRYQYGELGGAHEDRPSRVAVYVFSPDYRTGSDTSAWVARLIREGEGAVRTVIRK